MGPSNIMRAIGILALLVLCGGSARAQRVRGELRLEVHDPHGTAVSPAGELVSEANGFRRTFVAGAGGGCILRDISFWGFRRGLGGGRGAPRGELFEINRAGPRGSCVTR